RSGSSPLPRKLFSGPDDRRIKRALCIVAHPDDIEFFCAGTVVMLADRGVHVAFVLATSGDKGSHDPGVDSAQLAQMREREQGPPHETAEAWCFAGPASNLEVDVSAVLDRKIEARLAHESQTRSPAALRRRWRSAARMERFHQVDLR